MLTRQTDFAAIGTKWRIEVRSVIVDAAWEKLLVKINDRIEDFDKTYSRFRADSWVTKLSQAAGQFDLPADGYTLLKLYKKLYVVTDGSVTPLIGQVMADAGYDAEYSLQPRTLQVPPPWEDVIAFDKESLTLQQPALLDFGAAGKGYLVDLLGELLQQAGIDDYTVNGSGDIRQRSARNRKLEVGMENPYDSTEAIGIVQLGNKSLCASAGSKRQWGDYHHIIDPGELRSPTEIVATWVLAEDTMTADGLSTALFFTEPATLHKAFTFSYARLHAGRGLEYSQDFPITIFEET